MSETLDPALLDWAAHRTAPAPTHDEVQQLLHLAAPRRWSPLWFLVPVVALCLLVVVGVGIGLMPRSAPADLVVVPPAVPLEATQVVWTGHVEEAGDVFDIEGSLAPEDEVLHLDGTVRVQAASRGSGPPLIIAAQRWRVQVVGTRFTVVSDPFSVSVTEGRVQVSNEAGVWMLQAGDRFVDGALVRPVPETVPAAVAPLPSLPSHAALRSLLVAGQLDEARTGLQQRLARDPTEVASWTLLARLEVRAKDPAKAADAWESVISHGSPRQAQQGRYEAALLRIGTGAPGRAVPLLRAFLQTSDPLEAEARVHLGSAMLASGDASGRAELERVVASHPGTAAASRATALLARP